MVDVISEFTELVYQDWFPSFCEAQNHDTSSVFFEETSIRKLSAYDARWFLHSLDLGIVTKLEGDFITPKGKAKERLFWSGKKSKEPRPFTLWIEPIITIGALARLNQEFGWPIESLGAQSEKWAFDLVCYCSTSQTPKIVCEVKKDMKELNYLIDFMHSHSIQEPQIVEPDNSKERNAHRKIDWIRKCWPDIFWALGPGGNSHVFYIERDGLSQRFHFKPASGEALKYKRA